MYLMDGIDVYAIRGDNYGQMYMKIYIRINTP